METRQAYRTIVTKRCPLDPGAPRLPVEEQEVIPPEKRYMSKCHQKEGLVAGGIGPLGFAWGCEGGSEGGRGGRESECCVLMRAN